MVRSSTGSSSRSTRCQKRSPILPELYLFCRGGISSQGCGRVDFSSRRSQSTPFFRLSHIRGRTLALRELTPRRESLNARTLRGDESLVKTTAPDSPQNSIKQPAPLSGAHKNQTATPPLRYGFQSVPRLVHGSTRLGAKGEVLTKGDGTTPQPKTSYNPPPPLAPARLSVLFRLGLETCYSPPTP